MNAQLNRLYHLTFNTGDVRLSPRAEVSNDVLQIMREKGMPGSADGDSDFGFIPVITCASPVMRRLQFSHSSRTGKSRFPLLSVVSLSVKITTFGTNSKALISR